MRNWISALLLIGVFSLPACGGDDDDGGTTSGNGGSAGSGGRGGAGGTGGTRTDAGTDAKIEGGADSGRSDAGGDGAGGGDAGQTGAITVSKASGDTREDGTKATFTVVLEVKPTADVTVNFDSNDKTEGTVDQTSLTFTAVNWNAPQTVTVTGVDDELADGNQSYAAAFTATVSNDKAYGGLTPANVALVNVDNDTAGITVSAISGKTSEAGGQATFTVVLNSQPSADVTLSLDSDDKTEGTVDKTALTFTPVNWKAPQTVTVTGVDDTIGDGEVAYAVAFSATMSADAAYAAITPEKVAVSNVDNDTPGFTVSSISGTTGEDGAKATFTVVLNTQPAADVVAHLDSNDKTEGTVDKTSLTFTAANWNAKQTVTVTGVDDNLADGNQRYAVAFAATTSADTKYAGLTPANVNVTNVDNDGAGITVSIISGRTSESGAQATFTAALRSQPTANVTVNFDSNDKTEGTVNKTSLTFTAVNWNAPQTVTVTGVDDNLTDGNQVYAVAFTATTSADPSYAGLIPGNVSVINTDNDTAGFTVTPISGTTNETGGKATFTVVLNAQPTANVTVNFDSDDPGEGTVDKTSLTFTTVNWAAPQTVTVTGVDDNLVDGNQAYAVVFSATTSADAAYAALKPDKVNVTNVDNDTAGITVSAISGNTGENGAQATFTVVLNAPPSADVAVHFDSSDATEGTVDKTSLVFTAVNWNAPQTVTVTGIDDALVDGSQLYAVVFTATTSADAAYAGITPGNVAISNVDNDTAGITVGAIGGNTGENGTQATFTVVLNSEPTADVAVNFDSSDTTEGTVDKTSLTFTAANWNAPQTVTVTGVDDNLVDGTVPYAVVFSATASVDAAYAAITPGNVVVANVDNDSAGATVSAVSGKTKEDGTQATFTVVLNSQPFADVTLNFGSSDTTEGTVGANSLTFTQLNWNAPQTVKVTGVDDNVADGEQPYAIVFSATTSTDAAYAAITPGNVTLFNVDNDSAGITVSAISGNTGENGAQATFTVVLNSQPTADVTLGFDTTDASEGTLDKTTAVFTAANWNAPRTVTVTGIDDAQADGNQLYAVAFVTTASADPAYAAITPANVIVTNVDNDSAGITVSAASGKTAENGTQATFTVVLNSQPFADVTVNFNSNDTTEGTLDKTALTFTAVNWSAPQTVTVTGINDNVADGEQPYAVVFTVTTTSDPAYAAITPANVTLSNVDDDSAGINVSAISGNTAESGTQATFTVALNSQPTGDVAVSFNTNDATEGALDKTSLTFTASNWNAPQTVTVTGLDDALADGNQPYAIVFTATTSADAAYAAITPANVALSNVDNDSAGIDVSAVSGKTGEDGTQATFTVVLSSQPFADVTVHFNTNDATEGTVSVTSLTFTAVNWNAPQTVTVTGVNDSVADGEQPYAIVFTATTSTDATYAAITPGNVAVANVDNDTPGITVSAISGKTGEDGTQATFTVVLNSQPFANVAVHFNSNDTTEGTVGGTSLTFTPSNWNAPQTVTVTGVNDSVADGEQPYAIVFAATTSSDAVYAALTPGNVLVSNVDNDTAGITVSAISGKTNEVGQQAIFSIVLNSQPLNDVTVNFNTNDATEGSVSVTSVTFTTSNWNAPQTVTVTGVDDSVADGEQPYAIVFTATTSADAAYAAITPGSVAVSNVDNDTAGITVSAISGNTTENAGKATFTVVLNSQPFAQVIVNLNSNDLTEGTVSATSLVFTTSNWNAPQTVTVTGVNDDLADGSQPYAIVFTATTSADAVYAAITPANVNLSNADNDTAGVIFGALSGNTNEAGAQATFTIRLRSQPFAAVTLHFNSNDPTEGTVNVTSLTFTPANWAVPQVVTLSGVDDNLIDGNQVYAVVFTATTSADAAYAAITPGNVTITNVDNDTAGITVTAISGNTSESGTQRTFRVRLNSPPFASVAVNFNTNDATEGTLDKTSLTFTSSNWNINQTVTVTGVDDAVADGNQPYAVVFTATTSADAAYAAITPGNVNIVNLDNDSAGILVGAISGMTTELGGQASFTVRLNSQPTADVTVNFASNDSTEGTLDKTSLTFTASNWSTLQTVTVTGADDVDVDCDVAYAIVFTATTSADTAYAAITPSAIDLVNKDNDTGTATAYCLNYTAGSQVDAAVCQPWLDFTAGLNGSFSSIRVSGSAAPAGKTCNVGASATAICNALRTKASVSVACGADTWNVGPCNYDHDGDPAMELNINAATCTCPNDANAYVVRPCMAASCDCVHSSMGGLGTAACATSSQTFIVECNP